MMLKISDLHVSVDGKAVLNGLDLEVGAGEVHAIMGPNGSGKSTLAHVLAGRPGYEVTKGSVTYGGQDLLALQPEERARAGVFLGFQYPVEIPGVSNAYFLRSALNAVRRSGASRGSAGDRGRRACAGHRGVGQNSNRTTTRSSAMFHVEPIDSNHRNSLTVLRIHRPHSGRHRSDVPLRAATTR